MVGVGSSKDSGFFTGFGEWVIRIFLHPWCSHPLDDTLTFYCGFNGPMMTWTKCTYILDRVLLFFLGTKVDEVGW